MHANPVGEEWLTAFFSGENALSWQSIVDGTARVDWLSQVAPWLKFLETKPMQQPLILPLFDKSGPVKWYGVADEQRVLAQLSEEVGAFLGPSYTDFDGHLTTLSPVVACEAALRDRFGPLAVAFAPARNVNGAEVSQRLVLYQSVLARRPPLRDRSLRPFGRIRGDFDSALLAGDSSAAQSLLDELLATGRVTAEQRKCLDIRLLAGLGRYEELAAAHSLICSVADLSLPAQTLVDLITALNIVHIAPLEAAGDVLAMRRCFKARIAVRYGSLFRHWLGIRDTSVLRSFLLYESVAESPNRPRAEALFQAYPKGGGGWELAQKILATVVGEPIANAEGVAEEARQAIDDEDYERASSLCFGIIPHIFGYKGLLRCALALRSAELRERVLELFRDPSRAIAASLTKKDRERLDQLRASREDAPLVSAGNDWIEWARSVVSGSAMPLADLESQYPTWSPDDFIADESKCAALVAVLGNAKGSSEETFREAFPRLVEFFVVRRETPARSLGPIYVMLLRMIAWGGVASQGEMQLCLGVVEALLAAGPDKQSYEDCVDALTEILRTNDAPNTIEWGLNVADAIAIHPSPRQDQALLFFSNVVGLCQKWTHRLTTAHRILLEVLAEDFACADLLAAFKWPSESETEKTRNLADYAGLIAIYSLARSAAHRARAILAQLMPRATVELNEDLVATERLRTLAKAADIFVFAWRKSTHQAYYCAKEARRDRELAMAPGGGTASIVRLVVDSI